MIAVFQKRSLLALIAFALLSGVASAEKPSLLRMFGRDAVPRSQFQGDRRIERGGRPVDDSWPPPSSVEGSQKRAERLGQRDSPGIETCPPTFTARSLTSPERSIAMPPLPRRLRYANRYQYEAYAVLVGEYDTVEHPSIERDLKRIRTANPAVFQDPNELAAETDRSTPVTTVKVDHHQDLWPRWARGKPGPMSQAFVTRNPMLPEEYFTAPQVDSFVHQMNDGLHHSLLECKGKYTVVVKTFEGLGTIVDGKRDKDFQPSQIAIEQVCRGRRENDERIASQGCRSLSIP